MLELRSSAVFLLLTLAGLALGAQDRPPSFDEQRLVMVDEQICQRGIRDPRVLEAMKEVPRHLFVPPARRSQAYADHPLPIGYDQTISQPYVVALMTSLLDLGPEDRVLEVGTGSAYHAAVLSRIAREVYTIEIIPELARRARQTLDRLGYRNVQVREGDGYRGWPEAAPFDAILLTAAPPEIPRPLIDQLAVGGTLVAPVGKDWQQLETIRRTPEGLEKGRGEPVRFVPMTGEAQARGDGR